MRELDERVHQLQQKSFADATRAAYRSQWAVYIGFCELLNARPVPATTQLLCRYVAYLSQSRAFCTVQQYLNVIRATHELLGFPSPLQDVALKNTLQGFKRVKGAAQRQKAPLTPAHLLKFKHQLNFAIMEDIQIWAAMLSCFFGLLRVNHVVVKLHAEPDNPAILRRSDASYSEHGWILRIRQSKTVQFKERVQEVPLPRYPDSPICPSTALSTFLRRAGNVPDDAPLFTFASPSGLQSLQEQVFRRRLRSLIQQTLSEPIEFNTHSLRRGGATWLMSQGAPLHVIRILGNWASDSIFKYLRPDIVFKQTTINKFSPQ